jgi:hypothetical protein
MPPDLQPTFAAHLMGVYGNAQLLEGMSKDLKARMQGKTCFNFKTINGVLARVRRFDSPGNREFQDKGIRS